MYDQSSQVVLLAARSSMQQGDYLAAFNSLVSLEGNPAVGSSPGYAAQVGWLADRVADADTAVIWWTKAVEHDAGDAHARGRLGRLLESRKEHQAAVPHFRWIAEHDPTTDHQLAWGRSAMNAGSYAEALDVFGMLLAQQPDHLQALGNAASVEFAVGQYEAALAHATAALERYEPSLERNQLANLVGKSLYALGRTEEAIAYYAEFTPVIPPPESAARAHQRWQEQRDLQRVYVERAPERSPAPVRGLLNDRTDWADIEAHLLGGPSCYAVIDDFLTPEALAAVREHLLGDVSWVPELEGEMIVALDSGIADATMLRLADELRALLPHTVGEEPLVHLWAYQYLSYSGATKTHADFGRFSVNLWVTPDEYDVGPEGRGGLRIWGNENLTLSDARVDGRSKDLTFPERETEGADIIAHRANRAVIFDAMTVHATDTFEFAPGYEERRINVTYLFGWPPR